MEGETLLSIETVERLFHSERILPNIDSNIRTGNSLIDTDFYDVKANRNENNETEQVIKTFSWEKNFPAVFKQGGFDCVLGNPPWVSLTGKFGNDILDPRARQYLIEKYSGNTTMPNLYEYFVHKGLDIINRNGVFSFIVPDRLGFNEQFVSLRGKILKNFRIVELLYKIPFPDVTVDTLIFHFTHKRNGDNGYSIRVGELGKKGQVKKSADYLCDPEHRFIYESSDAATTVLKKIFGNKKCKPLGMVAKTTSGFGGKADKITKTRTGQRQIEVLKGENIGRYVTSAPYFFEFNKNNITGRTVDKNKLGIKEKVLLRKTGYPVIATYDDSGIFPEQSLYFIFDNLTDNSLKYFTALVNSKLFGFVYINRMVTNKNSIPQLKKIDLDKFPVYVCGKDDRAVHDKIVTCVDRIMRLQSEKGKIKNQSKLEQIAEEILHHESRINQFFYRLYGLKDKKAIKIVEGSQEQ